MGKSIREFAKEMSVMMPRLMREFLRREPSLMAKGDITIPQMAILLILKERNICMMSELARFLSVTTSATTGTVDRMVRTKLVKRNRQPQDRRVINIQITLKGKRTINTILRQRQESMMDIFSHLSSQERETYLNTIKKIYAILTRKRK